MLASCSHRSKVYAQETHYILKLDDIKNNIEILKLRIAQQKIIQMMTTLKRWWAKSRNWRPTTTTTTTTKSVMTTEHGAERRNNINKREEDIAKWWKRSSLSLSSLCSHKRLNLNKQKMHDRPDRTSLRFFLSSISLASCSYYERVSEQVWTCFFFFLASSFSTSRWTYIKYK